MGLAPRQWVILLTFYMTYLMFGACVFYHIEHNAETERRAKELKDRIEINELLVAFVSPDDIVIQKDILNRLSTYCNKPVTDYREDKFVNPYQWTFYHSVFFAFIVCSTLGYGNMVPTGTLGRYVMIAYALIGMPVNMILYTYLGEFFGKKFIKVYRKYKAYKFAQHMHANENYSPHRWSMIAKITLSLILPALIILIFLPSVIFTYFEGWDYSISVYYSFVTLLTIGFGDYVPTFQPHQEETFGIYFVFYQIFVFVWFVFGLSYILMLIGFIARGMQSKRLSRFEKQLTENIKLTHNRIWGGVTKDVGYLRRILNEIYIMRVRPVFSETNDKEQHNYRQTRSQSCPNLTVYRCNSPVPRRKRAMSENFFDEDVITRKFDPRPLQSRHSESNLMRIDRDKTFNPNNMLDNTSELLAQVVFALNDFNSNKEDPNIPASCGVDLFSDESILEDEWSVVTTNDPPQSQKIPKKFLRSRAKSLHPQILKISNNRPQYTWSGNNNDIQEFINDQVNDEKRQTAKIMHKKDTNGIVISIEKPKDNIDSAVGRRKSVFNAFNNIFKRRNTIFNPNAEIPPQEDQQQSVTPSVKISPPVERRNSIKIDTLKKPQFNGEMKRRMSILSNQSASSEMVLETTTIADLIRAIESAHTKNMMGAKYLANRRMSMVPQMTRRSSVSFSTPLETPPSAGSNYPSKSSLAVPRNRLMRPNRFSVTPVGSSDSPCSAVSLSPIIQRRMRRFSAVPSTTIMPTRRLSSSLHATPLALRRAQFKPAISPLAMPTTTEAPTESLQKSCQE